MATAGIVPTETENALPPASVENETINEELRIWLKRTFKRSTTPEGMRNFLFSIYTTISGYYDIETTVSDEFIRELPKDFLDSLYDLLNSGQYLHFIQSSMPLLIHIPQCISQSL